MVDKLYRVTWQAGKVSVHAPNEKRAIEIAVEYLRVPDAKRLSARQEIEQELQETIHD